MIFGKIKRKLQKSHTITREDPQEISNQPSSKSIKAVDEVQIQQSSTIQLNEQKVFGIYDPANYDFKLNMWSTTKAEELRSSLKRLSKIELQAPQKKY